MDYMFRDLRADEIECRVAQAKETGVSLLLYKDARCDQNILDETVGPMNWQRHHCRENANCSVSIWDKEKGQWISKEDTGTESNTEKEKGLASDSFKRSCFNWGIGRELYTAPFIWIQPADCTSLKPRGDKWQCFDSFVVDKITIKEKRIVDLVIRNVKSGKVCFRWDIWKHEDKKPTEPPVAPLEAPVCDCCGKVINGYKGANGKPVSVSRHVEASKKQFGRVLCLDCIKALQNNAETNTTN